MEPHKAVISSELPLPSTSRVNRSRKAFTLIELSIVLVIIGLLAGGVLVGRDLISAATVRSQISQIEKYNTAVNSFKAKFGYLPGDMPDPDATRFGFSARGILAGQGDGNGLLEGPPPYVGVCVAQGEPATFWTDLSKAQLIGGSFVGSETTYVNLSVSSHFPQANISASVFVIAFSDGANNYFNISKVNSMDSCAVYGSWGLTVNQAYNIDLKMDDGLPTAGNVQATALAVGLVWAPPATLYGGGQGALGYQSAAGSATTCFDDNNSLSNLWHYSISQNNGTGMNCALSFKFQ